MKRTILLSIVVLSSILMTSCGAKDRVSNPEDIGEQVIDLLEEMDDLTLAEFEAYFITVEDLHELANNEDLVSVERQQKALLKTSEEYLKQRYKFMYDRLKKSGKKKKLKIGRAHV